MNEDKESFYLSYYTDERGVLVLTDDQGRKVKGIKTISLNADCRSPTEIVIHAIPRVDGKMVLNRFSQP